MSTRLHIVVSEDLVARIDAARGTGQPRSDWIRRVVERALTKADARAAHRAVEQALDSPASRDVVESSSPATKDPVSESPAPAEQPRRSGPDVAAWRRAVEQALGDPGRDSPRVVQSPAPAEQPRRSGPDVAAWRRATQK